MFWIQNFLEIFGNANSLEPVLRIRDPVPFDLWIRDPGWVESQHPGIRDEQTGS